MYSRSSIRELSCGAAVIVAWLALSSVAPTADAQTNVAQTNVFKDGKAAFVVSDIGYALARDSKETGACPQGRSLGYREYFQHGPDGARNEGESETDYAKRIDRGAQKIATASDGQPMCMVPNAGSKDPFYRTVTGANVAVDGGIDLDGQDSHIKGKVAPGTCAHDDFLGPNGERGIDNQFYRAVGCINSFQPTGSSVPWSIEMLTGAWGILIRLSGVTDLHDSPNVEVNLYANADPIQLSPTRVPLPYATYATEQDPRFHSTARGRIVNGVLTTDPMDVRVHVVTNGIHLERFLKDARLKMTINPDGSLEGYMGGYTPVEAMYNFQFGFRDGTDSTGKPANLRLRSGSATGAANNLGYTCEGVYAALKQLADGHRDPKTGQCTSISTQYRLKAIPAFVVDAKTKSVNDALDKTADTTY